MTSRINKKKNADSLSGQRLKEYLAVQLGHDLLAGSDQHMNPP